MSYAQKLDFDPDLARRDRAYIDLDFCRRDFRIGKLRSAHLQGLPFVSYSGGAGFKTAFESDGSVTGPFAANELGLTPRGAGIWKASTNLLLGSAAPVTQNVTVAASTYRLSFQGTGTVTLSGVSSAGPLVGTGASDFVELTFTPTAGTLTLTVSGDVRYANLELGTKRTPWIPTTVASATRTADALALDLSRLKLPSELSLFVEWEVFASDGQLQTVVQARNTGTPTGGRNTIILGRNGSGNFTLSATDDTTTGLANVTTSPALTAGVHRAACSLSPGAAPTMAFDGSAGWVGSGAGALLGLNTIDIGSNAGGSGWINGFMRRLVVAPKSLGPGNEAWRSRQ